MFTKQICLLRKFLMIWGGKWFPHPTLLSFPKPPRPLPRAVKLPVKEKVLRSGKMAKVMPKRASNPDPLPPHPLPRWVQPKVIKQAKVPKKRLSLVKNLLCLMASSRTSRASISETTSAKRALWALALSHLAPLKRRVSLCQVSCGTCKFAKFSGIIVFLTGDLAPV